MVTMPLVESDRLRQAKVLVEIGELGAAEREVAEILDASPEHLEALSLFAKLKHMRRQLSLAVACWAQVQSKRSATGGQARMHLESMLHLAQDPVHGAGEFIAMGQFQLVQKPTAYLALEDAFRLYVARRPTEASATCRQVAHRYRDRDPEVYKLAVLAEAWIFELIGDLRTSSETLEHLGRERGFETDIDRLTALEAVYEKVGTRGALEAAVNICRHLERTLGQRSVLGRLALLFRRLGSGEEATSYERAHLIAYRKEMHRPTFEEIVSAASQRFFPLERLREIEIHESDLPTGIDARGQAIAEALRGQFEQARAHFASSTDLLDIKYLANLEAIASDPKSAARAAELYVRALRSDPTDLHVIGWILDREAVSPSKAAKTLFRDDQLMAAVLETLEQAVHEDSGSARLWRRLATLFALHGGSEARQRQFVDRAEVLERMHLDRNHAIGRVLSAAVYRFAGTSNGLVHEVWATRELAAAGQGGALRRDDILGNLTAEMRDDVRNTFAAVREYAQAKFPHLTRDLLNYNYGYKVTKEDEPSGGTSAGLPTALAFLSLFIQRPVLDDTASTGVLVTDAHDVLTVRAVGDAEHKVDAAYHRNLRMIVIPAGNRPVLEQSAVVPRAISEELVRYVSDLDEAVKLVFGDVEFL